MAGRISAKMLSRSKKLDSPVTESVPEAFRLPVVESSDAVVVASVTVLVAINVPVTKLDVVALSTIRLFKYALTAVKILAKRFVDEASVKVAEDAKRFVVEALANKDDEAINVPPLSESVLTPDL